MKYFNPNYWFKLWITTATLFDNKTSSINANSINNNHTFNDWGNNNTTF